MTRYRTKVIRQGIGKLVNDLDRLNAEFDSLLKNRSKLDPRTRDPGDLARASRRIHRMCALSHVIRALEYRIATARELLSYGIERRFQFRRRLHVRENGGKKRYDFWKI